MKSFSLVLWLCLATLAWDRAFAQGWEITPFGGYQFGGEFAGLDADIGLELDEDVSYGLMVDIDLDPERQVEIYFSRQETQLTYDEGDFSGTSLFDIDVSYYHVGGTYLWDEPIVKPFVVGTLGITHLDPDPPGLSSETRFSMSLGGGVKVMPTEHVGVRLEGRGFATFVDSSTSVFYGDGLSVYFSGDVFWQFQFSAGLVFRF
jgi:opacity protein-like surface antigen